MDEIDRANDHAMNLNADALKATRALVPEEKPEIADDAEIECEICGDLLDVRRARLGYSICPSCSQWESKKHSKINRRHSSYEYDD